MPEHSDQWLYAVATHGTDWWMTFFEDPAQEGSMPGRKISVGYQYENP